MRTIGRRQQQQLDAAIEQELGIPVRILMEQAGFAVAREAQHMLADGIGSLPVRIVCGHGQNAGDALAAARLLFAAGLPVTCFLDTSPPGTPEFAAQLATVHAIGIPCLALTDLPVEPALIIDGVYGTGFNAARPFPADVADCFSRIHAARSVGARVLAIDVPSGLDADTAFFADQAVVADRTVTFLFPKTGLVGDPGRDLAGEMVIDRLGLPETTLIRLLNRIEPGPSVTEWIDPQQVRSLSPLRPRRMHKGQGGRALLVAGSPGLTGAAILSGEAALRSGVGLLNLLTDSTQTDAVLARIPETMITGLTGSSDPDAQEKLHRLLAKQPAAAGIGPGIGLASQSADLLADLLVMARAVVVDADALTLIAADRERFDRLLQSRRSMPDRLPAVLTPHPGEFARLLPAATDMPRHDAARLLAGTTGAVVVLKGAATVIASPEGRVLINSTGNTGLARGGSGDVLTGLLLGLLAQGLDALDASVCAVYLHGLAADLAAAQACERTILPTDIISYLPDAFRTAGWSADRPTEKGLPTNNVDSDDRETGGAC